MEDENKTQNKRASKKYAKKVTLRFNSDEYAHLEQVTDDFSCTISQAIRYLIFDVGVQNKKMLLGKKSADYSLISIRQTFIQFSHFYEKIVNKLCAHFEDNSSNRLTISRFLPELISATNSLEKSINAVFQHFSKEESHAVSETKVPEEIIEKIIVFKNKNKGKDYSKNNFFFMEHIHVLGNIVADAKEYKKDNVQRMTFKVKVERRYDNAVMDVVYDVFADWDPLIESLKKGTQVFVSGSFSENRKTKEKAILADLIQLFVAQ